MSVRIVANGADPASLLLAIRNRSAACGSERAILSKFLR